MGQIKKEDVLYGWGLFGKELDISLLSLVLISILVVFTCLLSTRVSFYRSKFMRVVVFWMSVFSVWGGLGLYGMSKMQQFVIPYFEKQLAQVITTEGTFASIVFEQTDGFYLMLVLIPLIFLFFISMFVMNKYTEFDKELNAAFFEFEWTGKWLQKISKLEQTEIYPDIELGINSKTKEMVTLPGKDRTLNTKIIGSIGTGKTAALGLPIINQDLHHMTRYINDYPKLYQREDFHTEEVGGSYLSGISIIEPSNDLCQKALKLVKAHGIPDEAITYINPLDPNTPSINPLKGPVDKVAEVFAQVISGLSDSKDGGNNYFEQAQRNHLKQHIYLLKLHDPDYEVTFDDLIDMYNNPQLVHKMHVKLKGIIPENIDLIEERDKRNYWKIVQGVDEWFDLNLIPKQTRLGNMTVNEKDGNGDTVYIDAKAEHVQGLRNILNDIGANPLIRRVLFGKSNFDFDVHMAVGGVLLVNTAKGDLVNLARVLGKIVLMNLQNASFRRPPMVSSFHHILIDEAPDYLYSAFREFPAQSRKYKVIITTLLQTIAQLADQFGEHYMTTLIGTMRNRMVYGDVPGFDAEYFSKMFGEKFTYEEGQNEMTVSPLQDSPMSRSGSSYRKVREQAMTGGDIMFQDAFQCAVKIVQNNRPMPVVQIQANFVPKEEFKQAKYQVEQSSLNIWLEQRRKGMLEIPLSESEEESTANTIQSIEETEQENAEIYDAERQHAFSLDVEEVEKVLAVRGEPRPRDPVNYVPTLSPVPSITQTEENMTSVAVLEEEIEDVVLNVPNSPNNDSPPADSEESYQPSDVPQEAEVFANNLLNSLIEEISDEK